MKGGKNIRKICPFCSKDFPKDLLKYHIAVSHLDNLTNGINSPSTIDSGKVSKPRKSPKIKIKSEPIDPEENSIPKPNVEKPKPKSAKVNGKSHNLDSISKSSVVKPGPKSVKMKPKISNTISNANVEKPKPKSAKAKPQFSHDISSANVEKPKPKFAKMDMKAQISKPKVENPTPKSEKFNVKTQNSDSISKPNVERPKPKSAKNNMKTQNPKTNVQKPEQKSEKFELKTIKTEPIDNYELDNDNNQAVFSGTEINLQNFTEIENFNQVKIKEEPKDDFESDKENQTPKIVSPTVKLKRLELQSEKELKNALSPKGPESSNPIKVAPKRRKIKSPVKVIVKLKNEKVIKIPKLILKPIKEIAQKIKIEPDFENETAEPNNEPKSMQIEPKSVKTEQLSKFECCEEIFKSSYLFNKHKESIHQNLKLDCTCGKTFTYRSSMYDHKKICKIFKSSKSSNVVRKVQHSVRKCCEQKFGTFYDYKKHCKLNHQCSKCKKTIIRSKLLQIHEKKCIYKNRKISVNTKWQHCSKCGKEFTNVLNRVLHESKCDLDVTGSQCILCNKRFKTNSLLNHYELCSENSKLVVKKLMLNRIKLQKNEQTPEKRSVRSLYQELEQSRRKMIAIVEGPKAARSLYEELHKSRKELFDLFEIDE